MQEAINIAKELNTRIKNSEEYKKYIELKTKLYDNVELRDRLKEFKIKNSNIQNNPTADPIEAIKGLVGEYDELLHNSIVGDYIKVEQRMCKLMQQVYISLAEGLELEYLDE